MLLLPAVVVAQNGLQTLQGKVQFKDGSSGNYKLHFVITGTKISGSSFTTIADGTELQAAINGSVDRQHNTMVFKESRLMMYALTDDCMFSVRLESKERNGRFYITGPFVGTDNQGNQCDKGKIEFISAVKPVYLYEKDRPAAPVRAAPMESTPPMQPRRVTATTPATLAWTSDTCIISMWDGQVVDGDIVTVICNGKKVLEHYSLVSAQKQLLLLLPYKRNVITVTAESEGKAKPNTAEVTLLDRTTVHQLVTSIETGESAQIILLKE